MTVAFKQDFREVSPGTHERIISASYWAHIATRCLYAFACGAP